MPKSCADCPVCHCKGKDDPWNYYCVATMDDINIEEWDKERYITCPLKSVDGLIEKIKNIDDEYQSKRGVFLSATGCIQIIKEYCEVEDNS